MDGSFCSCSDAEKTPWLEGAIHSEHDLPLTFQSPPVLLAGDYGSVPRRMSVSSSNASSLDLAVELAQRVCESAGVILAMPTSKSSSYRLGSFIKHAVSNTARF